MEIRLMTNDDLEFFHSVRSESYMFLHDNTNYSLEENIKWFEGLEDPFFIVSIDNNEPNVYEPIGYFRTSNWVDDSLYIGMDIHPDYRGLKLAVPAYIRFMDKLKNDYSINKVYLEVLSSNRRAINIYNKLGFTIIDLKEYTEEDKSILMELTL